MVIVGSIEKNRKVIPRSFMVEWRSSVAQLYDLPTPIIGPETWISVDEHWNTRRVTSVRLSRQLVKRTCSLVVPFSDEFHVGSCLQQRIRAWM